MKTTIDDEIEAYREGRIAGTLKDFTDRLADAYEELQREYDELDLLAVERTKQAVEVTGKLRRVVDAVKDSPVGGAA